MDLPRAVRLIMWWKTAFCQFQRQSTLEVLDNGTTVIIEMTEIDGLVHKSSESSGILTVLGTQNSPPDYFRLSAIATKSKEGHWTPSPMVQIRREEDQGYGAFQGESRSLPARLKTQRGQQPGSWREASSRVSFECSLYLSVFNWETPFVWLPADCLYTISVSSP